MCAAWLLYWHAAIHSPISFGRGSSLEHFSRCQTASYSYEEPAGGLSEASADGERSETRFSAALEMIISQFEKMYINFSVIILSIVVN